MINLKARNRSFFKLNSVVPWKIFISVAVFFSLVACGKKSDTQKINLETGAPKKVRTINAQLLPMERTVVVTGSFEARERATLSVKVPGRLEKISVDIGSVAKKGDLLAQIERQDYELKVRQAAATLAQARARLGLPPEGENDEVELEKTPTVLQAKAVLEEATKNRDRIRELQRAKISSQSELDTVEAAYTVAAGKLQDALQDVRERKSLLAQRRAELDLAQKQLVDSTILAPFDGIVQQRQASLGEFLEVGTPLLVIAQIDPLRLRLEVPERDSSKIDVGQPLEITVSGQTNVYGARISRVSPMLTVSNRVLVVEADVPLQPALKPGLFAQAVIVVSTNDPAICIPKSAISSFVGMEKAFVAKAGKALEKSILTGRRKNGLVEVLSGISAGEHVVVEAAKVRSGQILVEEADAKAR
jgi:RND family efflux transporter MFP subunit